MNVELGHLNTFTMANIDSADNQKSHRRVRKQPGQKLLPKRQHVNSRDSLVLHNPKEILPRPFKDPASLNEDVTLPKVTEPDDELEVEVKEEPKRKLSHKTLEFVYDEKLKTSALVAEREVERNDLKETRSSASEYSPMQVVHFENSSSSEADSEKLTLENIQNRPEESTREKTFRLLKWILDDQDRLTS